MLSLDSVHTLCHKKNNETYHFEFHELDIEYFLLFIQQRHWINTDIIIDVYIKNEIKKKIILN